MDIQFVERNGNLIAKIRGEIDHHTADKIRKSLEDEFSESTAKNIVFDFAHVGFMDSSGIGMVIGRYKELQKTGGRVFAINIGPEISRIFDISGLRKIIPCFAGIDEIESESGRGM
ncbi:MAG: anti-sigma F factor antagonist [Defluviitaleaceae bacterium]|nr:anti-sigma F factor antagonist [Defluviitaleaceae bacterium]